MLSLYQLSNDFIMYMESEDDEEIANALAEITAGQIEAKAENWCHFLAMVEGTVEQYKAEEKRIATARKIMENKIERSKEYIKEAMTTANIDKLSAGTFKLTVAKTAGKLVIDDPAVIPAQYLTYVPASTVPNNAEIKEAIKAGEIVTGAHVEAGTSLRIK